MKELKEISRRVFLKGFPRYLAYRMYAFTEGCLRLKKTETEGDEKHLEEHSCQRVAQLVPERCLAWEGLGCQMCYLSCPLRDAAIYMIDQKPVINRTSCNGCAQCIVACKTVHDLPAIKLVGV